MCKYKKIAILGVGLIGGSLSLALRERKYASAIWGLFRTSEKAQRAKKNRVVDSCLLYTSPSPRD